VPGDRFDVSGNSGPNTGFNDDFCETPLESQIQQSACCGQLPSPSIRRHEAQPQFRRIYVNAVRILTTIHVMSSCWCAGPTNESTDRNS